MILKNYYNDVDKEKAIEVIKLVDNLNNQKKLSYDDFLVLLRYINQDSFKYLQDKAYQKRQEIYGKSVYIRGLIEISNYCIKNCYYCGIRSSNEKVERYRYDSKTILDIIDSAYNNGYRTIVMQGGEDAYFDDEILCDIISSAKSKHSDIAITLSLGERTYQSYSKLKKAGANRYLLRHESASESHYQKLHPEFMKMETRFDCLRNLKELNYQTGAGFMVGSPFQTNEDIVEDLLFLQDFQPEMIGIGPYLSHPDTPFNDYPNGDINHVLVFYSLARLICPSALIPSTTATSSLDKSGRYQALLSGCNVIMINLSLVDKRKNYSLYANKTYVGDESVEYINLVNSDIDKAKLKIDFKIGDHYERVEKHD